MSSSTKNLKLILSSVINGSEKIFITGHMGVDFDSIGASMGVACLAEDLGKEAYIIIDDEDFELEPGVKRLLDENKRTKEFKIIRLEEFKALLGTEDSLVIVDANKKYQVCVQAQLEHFQHIVVVDHHEPDSYTIKTPFAIINPDVSSSSEQIAKVLQCMKVRYSSLAANAMLAGIGLDTSRYKKNTTSETHDAAEKLILHGASTKFVNKLFLAEFETDKKVSNLVYNGSLFENYERGLFEKTRIAFTLNRSNPNEIYRKEELAKAADKLLDYDVDVSFATGYVKPGIVSISARSLGDVDVGKIMGMFNGGGNPRSAATKINTDDITIVEASLRSQVRSILAHDTSSKADEDKHVYVKV